MLRLSVGLRVGKESHWPVSKHSASSDETNLISPACSLISLLIGKKLNNLHKEYEQKKANSTGREAQLGYVPSWQSMKL